MGGKQVLSNRGKTWTEECLVQWGSIMEGKSPDRTSSCSREMGSQRTTAQSAFNASHQAMPFLLTLRSRHYYPHFTH